MKYILQIFAVCFLFSVSAFATEETDMKTRADEAYKNEKYEDAAKIYSKLAASNESAEISYNLGCCYYRLDNIAKSVLWFERALVLEPGDKDIRTNLEMARSKTVDKIVPRHEFILFSFFRSLVKVMSLQSWTYTCIFLFALTLCSLLLFFFTDRMLLRKVGFSTAVVSLLMCIIGNICAYQQRTFTLNRRNGIVMSPAVTVKSTPSDNGNDLFVVHEGTRVEIIDDSMKDWCEVEIADGKVGWISRNTFELI